MSQHLKAGQTNGQTKISMATINRYNPNLQAISHQFLFRSLATRFHLKRLFGCSTSQSPNENSTNKAETQSLTKPPYENDLLLTSILAKIRSMKSAQK